MLSLTELKNNTAPRVLQTIGVKDGVDLKYVVFLA